MLDHTSESGCKYGDKCKFLHTVAGGQPSKKSKKSGAKRSEASLKETIQLGGVFHDSPKRKSILHENGKLGSNHTVKFSKIPVTVVTANGEVQTNEEAQVYVHDLHMFVTPAVLSLANFAKSMVTLMSGPVVVSDA